MDLTVAVYTVLLSLFRLPSYQTLDQVAASLRAQGMVFDEAALKPVFEDCMKKLTSAPVQVRVCHNTHCQGFREHPLTMLELARLSATTLHAVFVPDHCQYLCREGPNVRVFRGAVYCQHTGVMDETAWQGVVEEATRLASGFSSPGSGG